MKAFCSHKPTCIPINHRPQKQSMAKARDETSQTILNSLYYYLLLLYSLYLSHVFSTFNFTVFHGLWAGRIGYIFLPLGFGHWRTCLAWPLHSIGPLEYSRCSCRLHRTESTHPKQVIFRIFDDLCDEIK